VRVVEQATVLRLRRAGQAGGARLRSEVRLAQATPLDEDLDCDALSAISRDGISNNARDYVLAVLSVGSSSGFMRSGMGRVEDIVADVNDITSDVGVVLGAQRGVAVRELA
jgi:hypothetical protein